MSDQEKPAENGGAEGPEPVTTSEGAPGPVEGVDREVPISEESKHGDVTKEGVIVPAEEDVINEKGLAPADDKLEGVNKEDIHASAEVKLESVAKEEVIESADGKHDIPLNEDVPVPPEGKHEDAINEVQDPGTLNKEKAETYETSDLLVSGETDPSDAVQDDDMNQDMKLGDEPGYDLGDFGGDEVMEESAEPASTPVETTIPKVHSTSKKSGKEDQKAKEQPQRKEDAKPVIPAAEPPKVNILPPDLMVLRDLQRHILPSRHHRYTPRVVTLITRGGPDMDMTSIEKHSMRPQPEREYNPNPVVADPLRAKGWRGRTPRTTAKTGKSDWRLKEKMERDSRDHELAVELGYETLVGNIQYIPIPGAKDLNRSWDNFLNEDPMEWGFPYEKGSTERPRLRLPEPYLAHQVKERLWKFPKTRILQSQEDKAP